MPDELGETSFRGGIVVALALTTMILYLLGSGAEIPGPALHWLPGLIGGRGAGAMVWLITTGVVESAMPRKHCDGCLEIRPRRGNRVHGDTPRVRRHRAFAAV